MQRLSTIAVLLLVVACGKKDVSPPAGGSGSGPGTGSAPVVVDAAGSAAGGSGSGSADPAGSGSGSGSGSAAGSGSSAAGSGSDAAFDFDKLTHDQKVNFMKTKVLPEMKAAFQKFDEKKFAKFTCKTCHGKDPVKTKYKMPNPELPKLDFAKLKAGKQEPKTAEFMGKVVNPGMAKLLNLPEHSEKNPDGFGCLACHLQKK